MKLILYCLLFRHKVVTLEGELIETVGTMSGTGKQKLRGLMGQQVEFLILQFFFGKKKIFLEEKIDHISWISD